MMETFNSDDRAISGGRMNKLLSLRSIELRSAVRLDNLGVPSREADGVLWSEFSTFSVLNDVVLLFAPRKMFCSRLNRMMYTFGRNRQTKAALADRLMDIHSVAVCILNE